MEKQRVNERLPVWEGYMRQKALKIAHSRLLLDVYADTLLRHISRAPGSDVIRRGGGCDLRHDIVTAGMGHGYCLADHFQEFCI